MLECEQILVLGVIILVAKKMRKICALFCSLGVLTSVSNRCSKSCEKYSQNLISYERAQAESFSPFGFLSRLSWGLFKMCAGIFSFLSSDNFADWVNVQDKNKKKTLKNWWKIGSVLVGADGFRDMMDALDLGDERADFELLKEVYDKNFKGKSCIILENLKENDFIASYNAIRFLEASIEFVGYWNAYCYKVTQEMLSIFASKANSLGLDKETMTVNEVLEVLEPGKMKEIVNDIVIILKEVSSNIDCVLKLKGDYLTGKSTFEDTKSTFVGIQSNQQNLEEELKEKLKNLRYIVDKV